MATTAVIAQAGRVTFQLYDAQGVNLVGAVYTLEATKIRTGKKTPRIDFTSTETTAGRRDFTAGNQEGSFNIEGIFDQAGNFDALWTTLMDGRLFAQTSYYITKPNGGNNPLIYAAKTMFEDVEINAEITADGSVLKFTAQAYVSGSFTKSGVDVTYVTSSL